MSIYEYDEERQRILDREEGREEGEERLAALVQILLDGKKEGELAKVIQDKRYREKMYKEYQI